MRKISILMAISLLMAACDDEQAPIDYLYVVDVQHSGCAKKEIVDKESLIFRHVEDLPLIACDGNVSVAKEDWLGLRSWIRSAIRKLKECASKMEMR